MHTQECVQKRERERRRQKHTKVPKGHTHTAQHSTQSVTQSNAPQRRVGHTKEGHTKGDTKGEAAHGVQPKEHKGAQKEGHTTRAAPKGHKGAKKARKGVSKRRSAKHQGTRH